MAKKSLPNVPNSQDRQQLQFQQAIKEIMEIGEGVRGDPLDRKVTLRDLIGSGIGRLRPGARPGDTGSIEPGFDDRPDLSVPPKPTGVTATPGLGTVFITWDTPQYNNHGFARVYRSNDDNYANAAIIGTATGTMYVDNLHGEEIDTDTGNARTYYYWVTFVSDQGIEGPPHDPNGLAAAPAMDPEYVLKMLEGSLTESQLHADLTTRLTDTDETLIEQKQQIDGLSASYTVKIDANGRVAGYGLSSEPNEAGENTSRFLINADEFGIFHPSASDELVFGVFDGKTVMDGAYIKNATITAAQIGNAAINTAQIADGSILSAKIGDAQIGSAKLAGVIQSDNYTATTGWAIYKTGLAYFNNAVIRGTAQSLGYSESSQGWRLDANGSFMLRGAGGEIILGTNGNLDYSRVDGGPPADATSNKTYFQSLAPSTGKKGDFWVDSDDEKFYTHDGANWIAAGKVASDKYTWIKYADNAYGSGMSDSPTGKAYIGFAHNKTTATEGTNPADYTWSLIKGADGVDGIQGPPGVNGQTLYTWIKYADTSTGSGMSDYPAGKAYMGVAYNKTTATESTNASDYTWSLIQGEQGDQGIPGPKGADGQTTYTWIKYATSPTGAGMSDSPTGKTYIGIAPNKTTPTESTNPAHYKWALFKGADGVDGAKGDKGDKGDKGATGATGPRGYTGDPGESTFTYYQAYTPSGAKVNELWYNTSDLLLRRFNGSAWNIITSKINSGTYIKNAIVDTLHLAGQAVTIPVGSYTAGAINLTVSYQDVATVSLTSTGAPITLFFSVRTEAKGGYDAYRDKDTSNPVLLRVLRGTTVVHDFGIIQSVIGRSYKQSLCSTNFIDTPGAGPVTYKLQVRVTANGTHGDGNCTHRSIIAMEVKR